MRELSEASLGKKLGSCRPVRLKGSNGATFNERIEYLLFAFQDAHDRGVGVEILVDGMNAAKLSGMLQGEPLGPDGWVARFSRIPRDAER